MKIGFLVIATEVLEGKITDSNTKALAEFLKLHQLEIESSIVCRDSQKSIRDSLQFLADRCDVIITSGGLGPTKDDITKETLGAFLGRKLIFNPEALKVSEENYRRMGRIFPGSEHGYCWLPEGFLPLYNSTGFAPCFYTSFNGKYLLSGPGVPREFKSLLADHFETIFKDQLPQNQFSENVVARTKYIPEEKIFAEIDPELWEKLEVWGEVSSLPFLMGVDVGVKIRASSAEELRQKKGKVLAILKSSPLAKNIWNFGAGSIEEKIVEFASQNNLTFGFAESAAGGLCSHRITNVSGSSQCFKGSIVSYAGSVKQSLLHVDPSAVSRDSAVSAEVSEQMATGARQALNVDVAVSITGFAGPGDAQTGKCFVGVAHARGVRSFEPPVLRGEREAVKMRFSQAVLFALLESLEEIAGN